MNRFNQVDRMSVSSNSQKQNQLLISSDPILLLTPSPSYLSLLQFNNTVNNSSPNSNANHLNNVCSSVASPALMIQSKNIVIESSILYLRQFKKLLLLLIDSIETNYTHNCIVYSFQLLNRTQIRSSIRLGQHCLADSHYDETQDSRNHRKSNGRNNQKNLPSHEELINKLNTHPKSLKVQSRRCILNQLIVIQKKSKSELASDRVFLIKNQVLQLPLPKRMQNYLLYLN